MPLVSDAGLAREIVEAVKYPPLGNRGLDGAGLDGDFGLDVWHEGSTYIDDANRETFIVLQIETPGALADANPVESIPGKVEFIEDGADTWVVDLTRVVLREPGNDGDEGMIDGDFSAERCEVDLVYPDDSTPE